MVFSRCSLLWLGWAWLVAGAGLTTAWQDSETEAINSGTRATEWIRDGFVISPGRGFGGRGRNSLPRDPLEAAWISGQLRLPDPQQESSPSAPGLNAWRHIQADENGNFNDRDLASGWLVTYVDRSEAGPWLLRAQGHGTVRVNGEPRPGDIYSHGNTELPVWLNAGRNTLIFAGARGRIQAQLTPATKPVYLQPHDPTFPQVIRGETDKLWGAILIANTTGQSQSGWKIKTGGANLQTSESDLPELLPFSTRKVAFAVQPEPSWNSTQPVADTLDVQLELLGPDGVSHEQTAFAWEVRNSEQTHRRTFLSAIDGSVQFYGVVPPQPDTLDSSKRPALYLTLHGAGVDGFGQANVYAPKPNAYVVAATNRRPFGFDWEDWGRWDALEVLENASRRFGTDPRRTYLTGHSMGGHGTWHIGSLFPDRFAALGPSAGWISFATYGGGSSNQADDPITLMLRRSQTASDTLARINNLATQGIYILHGDNDDNVPVAQARTMREQLGTFHPDFVYKEQPGAGHWWGNPCCDWPPLFAFFESHELPLAEKVSRIEFRSPGPHVSPDCHWATIWSQQRWGLMSHLNLQLDDARSHLTGSTENVQTLCLNLNRLKLPTSDSGTPGRFRIELDGAPQIDVALESGIEELFFRRTESRWEQVAKPEWTHKHPSRSGMFKEAFRNRFLLVYGTGGSAEENAWMLARAKFDAETFWYRGNGSVDVASDANWKTLADPDRNIIVVGNATINAAWRELLGDAPVRCERSVWCVPQGEPREESACLLMIRPRPGSCFASVGAIGGTDLSAMRATHRLPVFSSGTGYPDLLIAAPEYLTEGVAAVRWTGFFGNDWSFESGEWAGSEARHADP